jgi:hypothetical protein
MNRSRTPARRWQVAGVGAVAVVIAGVGLGVASAAESGPPTVSCPAVAGKLGAVPAQAQAEIERNLALLNTQIGEANKRLVSSQGEGGANFIQNAILGPLKDKRVATINRMATAIGRNAAKPVLDVNGLATCSLNENGGGAAAPEPTDVPAGNNDGDDASAGAPTVDCPAVADELGAVPAQAQAEIERNLALLNTQIGEANKRLVSSQGEGGANFIQNAILGPLKDKRVATINRMATAIGRNAAKPVLDVDGLATCSLNENGENGGGAAAEPEPTEVPAAGDDNAAGGDDAAAGDAPTVNCPDVTGLPAIPAQAQAEVTRNLKLLDTQIAEANNRLVTSQGQGGPAFIQNAILGPLEDKRVAVLNRIETAIGRNAARPEGLEKFAPCSLNE